MAGIQIPISAETVQIQAATNEIRALFAGMANDLRKALDPARQVGRDVSKSMKGMAGGTKQASLGVRAMTTTLQAVKSAFHGLLAASRTVWRGISAGANSAARAVKGVFSGMASAVPGGRLLGPLAGVAGIAGSIALLVTSLKTGVNVAGEIERTGVALEALTGSGAAAKAVLDEMRATWVRTGVSIADQAGTIQKFLALGFSQADAVQLQKNILDVAGAVGMTSTEAALLGSALAQVKAKGVVSMEELRQQIAEKGVPVFEALANRIGVTQAELIKLVEDGKVPADELLAIFLNMEGAFGKFVGGANRMGMTFLGLVNRLRGAWNLLLADFAAPVMDAIKPVLLDSIGLVERFRATAVSAGQAVGNALLGAFALIKSGKTMELLGAGFRFAVAGAVDVLMRGLRGAVAFLVATIPPIFEAATAKLRDGRMWEGIKAFFDGVASKISAAMAFDKGTRESNEAAAESAFTAAKGLISAAGKTNFSEELATALQDGIAAAAEAMSGPAGAGFAKAREDMQALLSTVREEVAAMRKETAIPPAGKGGESAAAAGDGKQGLLGQIKDAMVLTTSLARVGGGGFGMTFTPMITEQRKGNTLLQKIEQNTRSMGGGVPAIV